MRDAGSITNNMTDEEKKLFWELVYLSYRDKKTVRSLQPIEQYLYNIMMKMLEPKRKSAEDQIALAPPVDRHNISFNHRRRHKKHSRKGRTVMVDDFLHDNYYENLDLEQMKRSIASTHKGAEYIVRMRRLFIERVSKVDSDGKQAHYHRLMDREFLVCIFHAFNQNYNEAEQDLETLRKATLLDLIGLPSETLLELQKERNKNVEEAKQDAPKRRAQKNFRRLPLPQ